MTIHALIPAAGSGRRMNCPGNKQYLDLAGRQVLARTLELFERCPAVASIQLVVPAAEIRQCRREVVERYGFSKVSALVAGGAERQESVRLGLESMALAADDLVLIHDGARPLLSEAVLQAVLAEAQHSGACLVAVPVKDTIKEVVAGRVQATPDRQRLWAAQTPQAFRYGLICEAHRQARMQGYAGTDDAALVERLGHPVAIVPGDYRNIKITTPDDLLLAAALLTGGEEESV